MSNHIIACFVNFLFSLLYIIFHCISLLLTFNFWLIPCIYIYIYTLYIYINVAAFSFRKFYYCCKAFWYVLINFYSSVTMQKGKSQNGCFKKTKHVKFSKKQIFLTPWYAHIFCFIIDVLTFQGVPIMCNHFRPVVLSLTG